MCQSSARQQERSRAQLRIAIAKLLGANLEIVEQDRALDSLLLDLPHKLHSCPARQSSDSREYFYKHFASCRASKRPKNEAGKQKLVARESLKLSIKNCKAALKATVAAAASARNLSAFFKAKAHKSPDSQLAALQAEEVDLFRGSLADFNEELLKFTAESALFDDAVSDDALAAQTADADAYLAKAAAHKHEFQRIKKAIALLKGTL